MIDREHDQKKTFFKNIEEFYNEDLEGRRYSREADYGVNWKIDAWPHRWRVSYVQNTGEVYAVHIGENQGPVIIIGAVPVDEEPDGFMSRQTYYRTLDAILEGYGDHCWERNGLLWVTNKLRDSGHGV